MKNLVMAAAKGYGRHDLEPFIVSFKKNISNANLVLFVDDISEFTLKYLNDENLTLIQIPNELKDTLIVKARWEMYKNFLDEHAEYENILVTDVRDVIFQDDLFSKYADYKNFLVYAVEADLIKNDVNNQVWIKNFFGNEELEKIKDNPIVCCGTAYGTRAEMETLLVKMIEHLKTGSAWGDEQAAMNYLIHNKLLPIENLIASDVETGEIFTAGIVKDIKISNDKILRGNGEVPAIVHQYNGHSELLALTDKIYRAGNFTPNENFKDAASILDQISCLVQIQNFDSATKLFVQYILYKYYLIPYGNKILKLAQLILKKYTPDADILFLAVQKVLVAIFKIDLDNQQLNKVYDLLVESEKNSCAVYPEFKNFVRNVLVTFTDVFYKNNLPNLGLLCVKRLSEFEVTK